MHDVSVMDGRFQTGTVNVHTNALNLNIQYLTLVGVQSCGLELHTSYSVDNMYDKFHGCTVHVQAAKVF